MPTLICKRVTYYSEQDEAAFFEWLKRIGCIKELNGRGDELYLHIARKKISNANLRELIAIFERYKIDMKQLAPFLNDKNSVWFKDNPHAFWYRKVFGKG